MVIVTIISFLAGLFIAWMVMEFRHPFDMDEYSDGFEDGFNLAEKIYQDQYSDQK